MSDMTPTPARNAPAANGAALHVDELLDGDEDELLDAVQPAAVLAGPGKGMAAARRNVPAETSRTEVGTLVDEGQDKMVMHTKEGMFLFAGRAHDTANRISGIVGGRRAAAAARSVWFLSANDNPYAEWGLISTTAALDNATRVIDEATATYEKEFEACRKRGLSLSVQCSKQPAELEIGFSSPYGYAIAELVLRFDYFVRLVKTLVRKDRLTEDQGREAIAAARRPCRAAFEVAVRFERYLSRPELRDLSRNDYLPTADETAKKRIQAAVEIYGEVPREVLTGQQKPRHSRRRGTLTAQELKLLSEIDLNVAAAVTADTAALI